jgi:hypothetical protein
VNVAKTKVMRISRQPYPVQIMIDQKQLESVEYTNYLGSIITNDARCRSIIQSQGGEEYPTYNKKNEG